MNGPRRRRDDETERELAQACVQTVGQILSNYQAALHLLEEAVTGVLGELPQRAHEVFAPVLEACAGVAPGLDDLVKESMGGGDDQSSPARALRDQVIAERQRIAVTHSRLITRQTGLVNAAEEHAGRAALVAAAERLDALETGSHSAGALFNLLRGR